MTDMLSDYFKEIVDTGFTAEMEDKLDDVEVKALNWKEIVRDFYGTLKEELDIADKAIEKVKIEDQMTDEICELCGKPMVIKQGRFGEFLACSGYPECKNTKPLVERMPGRCPKCGSKTRTMIREHMVLEDFPLFCPKCRYTCVIRFIDGKLEETVPEKA